MTRKTHTYTHTHMRTHTHLIGLHSLVGLEGSGRLLDVAQSFQTFGSHLAGLGVGHLIGKARNRWRELRQEGGGLMSVVD